MSLLTEMPHECRIQRRIRTKGSLGGSRDGRTVLQTGVMCWQQQASASEMQDYEKRGINITHKVFFPVDPQVEERDEIVITKRYGETIVDATRHTSLDVMSYPHPDASAGLGVVWRVMVKSNTGSVD